MPRGHKYIKKYRNSHGNWTYIYPDDLPNKEYGDQVNPNNSSRYDEMYRIHSKEGYGSNDTWDQGKDELLKSLRKRDSADLARFNTPSRQKHELEKLGYKSINGGRSYVKGNTSWTENGRGEYFRGKHTNYTAKTSKWRSYDKTTDHARENLGRARRDIGYNERTNTPNFVHDTSTTHYAGKIERGKKKIKAVFNTAKKRGSRVISRGRKKIDDFFSPKVTVNSHTTTLD